MGVQLGLGPRTVAPCLPRSFIKAKSSSLQQATQVLTSSSVQRGLRKRPSKAPEMGRRQTWSCPRQGSSRPNKSRLRNPELGQNGETPPAGTASTRRLALTTARTPLGMTATTDIGQSPLYGSTTRTRPQPYAGLLHKDLPSPSGLKQRWPTHLISQRPEG